MNVYTQRGDSTAAPGFDVAARLPFTMVSMGLAFLAALIVGWLASTSWVAAFLMAVAVAGLAAVLTWPAAGMVLLATLPALSGLARGLVVPGLRPSEVIATFVAGSLILLFPRHRTPRFAALDAAAIAYVILSVVIPAGHVMVSGTASELFGLLGPLQFLLLYGAAVFVGRDQRTRVLVIRTLILTAVPINTLAFLQAANVGPTRAWITAITENDPNTALLAFGAVERATSLFPHWHVLAGFNLIVLLLVLALLLADDRAVLPRTWLASAGLITLAGMVVAVTATPAIGLAIGALVIALLGRDVRRLVAWSIPALVAVTVAFWPLLRARILEQGLGSGGDGKPQTVGFRLEIWTEQYIPAIAGRPLLGYGPYLPERISFPFSESIYFSLLLRGGAVLLVAYLVFLGLAMMTAWQTAHRPGLSATDRALARATVAVLIALIPMQFLFPYLLTSGLPHALWIILGLTRAVGTQSLPGPLTDRPTLRASGTGNSRMTS